MESPQPTTASAKERKPSVAFSEEGRLSQLKIPQGSSTAESSPSLAGLYTAKAAAKQFKAGQRKSALGSKAEKVYDRLQQERENNMSLMGHLTGYLFESPDDIPEVLKPAYKATEEKLAFVQSQLDTYKPMIETLIYWESLTTALFITLAISLTWFLTKLGFGIVWVALIVFATNGAFKRNYARLRKKIKHEMKVSAATKRMETDFESVEWMNNFLEKFWAQYEPGLSEMIASNVNAVLEVNKPTFLDELALSQFTLGSEAPRIESIKAYPRTADDFMMMDWQLNFEPFDDEDISKKARLISNKKNSKIELVAKIGAGPATIPIPILLTEVAFRGLLRIQMKFCSVFPHIELVEFGFLSRPEIDFILRPLKGMDLMDTPGLSSFLTETIDWALDTSIVNPVMIKIPLLEWMGGVTGDPVVGILILGVYEAKSLRNTELAGKADPYVKLNLGGVEIGRTKVIDNDLNPYWGETKYILIHGSVFANAASKSDEFSMEVYDFNNLSKDRLIGATDSLKLSKWVDILQGEGEESTVPQEEKDKMIAEWGSPHLDKMDIWKKLISDNKPIGGDLRFSLSYYKIPSLPADPQEAAAVQKEMLNTGILTVTVHQAKELAIPSKSCATFIKFEINNDAVGRTLTKKKTNAPVFEQVFDSFISDMETSRLKFTLCEDKDGSPIVGTTVLNLKNVLTKEDKESDWYLLNGKSGMIRLSFKYTSVSLDDDNSDGYMKKPIGVARINVVEAKGLLNVETFSKSDPYTSIFLEGKQIGRTRYIDNTLDPQWNEIFYTVVYSHNARLAFQLYDYNNYQKDKKIGRFEYTLDRIIPVDNLKNHGMDTPTSIGNLEDVLNESRYQKDGLKVNCNDLSADLWCPLYLTEDGAHFVNAATTESAENSKKSNSVKQKGNLHVQVDLFPVLSDGVIKPEKVQQPAALKDESPRSSIELLGASPISGVPAESPHKLPTPIPEETIPESPLGLVNDIEETSDFEYRISMIF